MARWLPFWRMNPKPQRFFKPLPAVGAVERTVGIFRAVAEPRLPTGPASPVPVHILLRRYLS